jgi:hypothetical protein
VKRDSGLRWKRFALGKLSTRGEGRWASVRAPTLRTQAFLVKAEAAVHAAEPLNRAAGTGARRERLAALPTRSQVGMDGHHAPARPGSARNASR